MSVPELTYHAKINSWDLISQLLNNWIRLKLASEWDPSKELAVFMGNKMRVIQIKTLTEYYLVLSWGQTEEERKNKIVEGKKGVKYLVTFLHLCLIYMLQVTAVFQGMP